MMVLHAATGMAHKRQTIFFIACTFVVRTELTALQVLWLHPHRLLVCLQIQLP